MEILHRRRRATVEDLRAELPKPPSRSSVRKLLDIMIERGLLAREYDGPRFVYFPVANPEEASRSAIRQLLQTFFNDSPSSAAAAILAQTLVGERLSATSRHLLWTLAIVGLLVLPLLYGMLPTWAVARATPTRAPEFARTAEAAVTRFASDMASSLSAPAGSGDG